MNKLTLSLLMLGTTIFSSSVYSAADQNIDYFDNVTTRVRPELIHRLPSGMIEFAATKVGNCITVAGGIKDGNIIDGVNSIVVPINSSDIQIVNYNNILLSEARYGLAAAACNNVSFFAGGFNGVRNSDKVDIFIHNLENGQIVGVDRSLLNQARRNLAGAACFDFVVFAGGKSNDGYSKVIDAFYLIGDQIIKLDVPFSLSVPRAHMAGSASISYVVFAGGLNDAGYSDRIDILKQEMNRIRLITIDHEKNKLSQPRAHLAIAQRENYFVFAGGKNENGASDVIDVLLY